MLIDNLNYSQENPKLYLCKPDLNKTTIANLKEAYNIKINIKFGNINELSFTLPYDIDIQRNPNIDLVRDRFLIKFVLGNYIEYFTIRIPTDSMDEDKDEKSFVAYSLGYELNDKQIKAYNVTSYNAREVLVGNGVDKTGILNSTLWTIDYIDPEFELKYRSFEIPSATVLDGIFSIATTFGAIIVWDTVNRRVSLYKEENLGLDRGLKISFGRYLKSLNKEVNSDDVCTRLKIYGKNNISIQSVNATGTNYIEDFSYFLYPFQRDELGNVIKSSNYMSDSLCNALLDYQELISNKEPITKTAEDGTTTTNITIANHGLVVGDYISNISKNSEVRKVIAIVDVNNFTIESPIINQISGDKIDLYKDGTFGKLLYQKQDKQEILTTLENELSTLENELAIIQDDLDVANANGTDTTQLITDKNNKQAEIDAKQSEIDQINSDIATIDNSIANLQSQIDIENNLTGDQLLELNQFVIEREVTNEFIDNPKELLLWGKKEFEKIKTPPVMLKVNIVDLFKCLDKECQLDREKVTVGEIVTINYDKMNIDFKAKITEMNIDFEDSDSLEITIANVQEILTDEEKFLKMINQSMSTSTTVDLKKYKWSDAVDKTDYVSQLLNQAWDTTRQKIVAGVNETVDISRRGIIVKDPADPLNMIIIQHGLIALSTDGGDDWHYAITPQGIIGERILGQIIAGNNLIITNGSGTFRVDNDGVTIDGTKLTITNGGIPTSLPTGTTFGTDNNTSALFHFDRHLKSTKGIAPVVNSNVNLVDGKFDNGVKIESTPAEGFNLMPLNSDNFQTGWESLTGTTFSFTSVADIPNGAIVSNAWELITTGIGSPQIPQTWRCLAESSVSGLPYSFQVWVKNKGNYDLNVYFFGTNNTSKKIVVTNDSVWHLVTYEGSIGDGNNLEIRFEGHPTDTNDFIVCQPKIEQNSTCTNYTTPHTGLSEGMTGVLKYPQSILNPTEGTIFGWVNVENFNSNINYILSTGYVAYNNGDGLGWLNIYVNSDRKLQVDDSRIAGVEEIKLQSIEILQTNAWYSFTYTWGSKGRFLYVNGNETISNTNETDAIGFGYPSSDNGAIQIGLYNDNPEFSLNGLLDELRIDNIQRTDEEIQAWHESNVPFTDESQIQMADTTVLTNEGVKVSHNDGTYTLLSADGLERYTATDKRQYFYLVETGTRTSSFPNTQNLYFNLYELDEYYYNAPGDGYYDQNADRYWWAKNFGTAQVMPTDEEIYNLIPSVDVWLPSDFNNHAADLKLVLIPHAQTYPEYYYYQYPTSGDGHTFKLKPDYLYQNATENYVKIILEEESRWEGDYVVLNIKAYAQYKYTGYEWLTSDGNPPPDGSYAYERSYHNTLILPLSFTYIVTV